jgi:hypothetical protein
MTGASSSIILSAAGLRSRQIVAFAVQANPLPAGRLQEAEPCASF